MIVYVCHCYFLNLAHPHFPPLCPRLFSTRFVSLIYLYSIYRHWYMILVLFLTYVTLYKVLGSSTSPQRTQTHFFLYGWIIFHCTYIEREICVCVCVCVCVYHIWKKKFWTEINQRHFRLNAMKGKKDAWKNNSSRATFSEHHMQDESCDPANASTG